MVASPSPYSPEHHGPPEALGPFTASTGRLRGRRPPPRARPRAGGAGGGAVPGTAGAPGPGPGAAARRLAGQGRVAEPELVRRRRPLDRERARLENHEAALPQRPLGLAARK